MFQTTNQSNQSSLYLQERQCTPGVHERKGCWRCSSISQLEENSPWFFPTITSTAKKIYIYTHIYIVDYTSNIHQTLKPLESHKKFHQKTSKITSQFSPKKPPLLRHILRRRLRLRHRRVGRGVDGDGGRLGCPGRPKVDPVMRCWDCYWGNGNIYIYDIWLNILLGLINPLSNGKLIIYPLVNYHHFIAG